MKFANFWLADQRIPVLTIYDDVSVGQNFTGLFLHTITFNRGAKRFFITVYWSKIALHVTKMRLFGQIFEIPYKMVVRTMELTNQFVGQMS